MSPLTVWFTGKRSTTLIHYDKGLSDSLPLGTTLDAVILVQFFTSSCHQCNHSHQESLTFYGISLIYRYFLPVTRLIDPVVDTRLLVVRVYVSFVLTPPSSDLEMLGTETF